MLLRTKKLMTWFLVVALFCAWSAVVAAPAVEPAGSLVDTLAPGEVPEEVPEEGQDPDEKADKKAKKKAEKEAKKQAREEAKAEKERRKSGKVVQARVVGPVEGATDTGPTPEEPAVRATQEATQPAAEKTAEEDPASSVKAPEAASPAVEPVTRSRRTRSIEGEAEPAAAPPEVAEPTPATAPVAEPSVPVRRAVPVVEAERAAAPRATAESRVPDRPDVVRERIVVSEVLLDVLVTDRKGKVIEGLGPEDFVVEENGEIREVTSVVFYGGEPELAGSGVGGERRTDRYFLLLFHDQAQALPALMSAQLDTGRWARRWIDQELQPNDQVAVLGYDVRLKLYQDFTRDKEALRAAVNRAAAGKKEIDRGWREDAPPPGADSPSLAVNLPEGKALARQSRKLQEALALVGRAAEGIVGRKNLMLFSVGFGEIVEGPNWHPDPRYYPDMKESLNTGNVAVYSIDLLGSQRGNPAARGINDSLSALSSDTGGYYYWSFTNPLTPMRQVTEDNLGYYLLSYRTEYERGSAGYRDVKVEAKDGSLRVRARKGYRFGDGT